MKTEQREPRSLKPWPNQPRRISDSELQNLRASIREFGFVQPLVIQKSSDQVIGGWQRNRAAILEKLKTVPVVILDIEDDRAKALNLALNRIGGEFDMELLPQMLRDLSAGDRALTGFGADELDEILSSEPVPEIEKVDLRPPPSMTWILLGVPFDDFGEVREHIEAIQKHAAISVQSSR